MAGMPYLKASVSIYLLRQASYWDALRIFSRKICGLSRYWSHSSLPPLQRKLLFPEAPLSASVMTSSTDSRKTLIWYGMLQILFPVEYREYQIQPALMERLSNLVVPRILKTLPEVQIEIENTPRAVAAVVRFPSIVSLGSGPLSSVKVELFGMGIDQPNSRLHVQTYLADYEKQLDLPSIDVSTLDPKVIFWQKLTIIQRANLKPLADWKLARHWTDVRDLHNSLGYELLADEIIIGAIIDWSAMIQNQTSVNYHQINSGGLLMIPKVPVIRQSLVSSLAQTISNGYYPHDLDVEQLIMDCELIEKLINEHFSKQR